MLPSAHRLRDPADFRSAVRSGARAGSGTLVVHLRTAEPATADPEGGLGVRQAARPTRVGLVVSKAVGIAVVRNRVKRRLRHLCRDVVAELPSGSVLVVRALAPAAAADHDRLADDLARCLRRVVPAGAR